MDELPGTQNYTWTVCALGVKEVKKTKYVLGLVVQIKDMPRQDSFND